MNFDKVTELKALLYAMERKESNSGRFRGCIINNNMKVGSFWPEFFRRWRQVAQ